MSHRLDRYTRDSEDDWWPIHIDLTTTLAACSGVVRKIFAGEGARGEGENVGLANKDVENEPKKKKNRRLKMQEWEYENNQVWIWKEFKRDINHVTHTDHSDHAQS